MYADHTQFLKLLTIAKFFREELNSFVQDLESLDRHAYEVRLATQGKNISMCLDDKTLSAFVKRELYIDKIVRELPQIFDDLEKLRKVLKKTMSEYYEM